MNEKSLSLPPGIHRALHQWYSFSLICLAMTLLGITALHLHTYSVITDIHNSENAEAPELILSEQIVSEQMPSEQTLSEQTMSEQIFSTQATIQKEIDLLSAAYQQHQPLAPLMRQCMDTLTPGIHITSATVYAYNRIHIRGNAQHPDDVTHCIQTITSLTGFTHVVQCALEKNNHSLPAAPHVFTITLQKPPMQQITETSSTVSSNAMSSTPLENYSSVP